MLNIGSFSLKYLDAGELQMQEVSHLKLREHIFIPVCIGMQLLKVSGGLQVVAPAPSRPSWWGGLLISADAQWEFSSGHQH